MIRSQTFNLVTTRCGEPVRLRLELHAEGSDDAAVAAHRDIAAVVKGIEGVTLERESPVFRRPTSEGELR